MKDTARKKERSQGTPHIGQLALAAMFAARETLYETVVHAGMGVLAAMLEEDRTRLCGRRYQHDRGRRATRAGSTEGELAFGGRRIRVPRPRVRSCDGEELPLPTWKHFSDADPLTPRAVEQMVLGVSTRNYERSLEPLPASIESRGTSKSAVSRRFVTATEQTLTDMMGRDLSGLAICALVIDGIHIGEHLVVVALGVDEQGDKHVLGLHEGATENENVCKALIEDLVARGVRADRSRLFVIDGSKALVAAIRKTFGRRSLIQRCQVHSATRKGWSEGREGCDDFLKFCLSSSGCETRPARVDPHRPEASLARRAATHGAMRRHASARAVGMRPRKWLIRDAQNLWNLKAKAA